MSRPGFAFFVFFFAPPRRSASRQWGGRDGKGGHGGPPLRDADHRDRVRAEAFLRLRRRTLPRTALRYTIKRWNRSGDATSAATGRPPALP